MSDLEELKPARPEPESSEEQSYLPKLPWKWIGGIALFVGASIAIYQHREQQEEDAVRSAIRTNYVEKLAPLVERHDELVSRILEHTEWAARREGPSPQTDPRLDLDNLHLAKGLYLRLTVDEALKKDGLRAAAAESEPDAIARCLGLSPYSAGEYLARGSFLEKAWFEQADDAQGVMKLRVIAEELRQRSERDLPFVAEALQSQWFLLVLQRGPNRRDAPVDAYLWDLRTDKLLLSKRVQADGALVSARIEVAGAKKGNYGTGVQTGAAQDCSIASQLRAATGSPGATFEANPPLPRAAIEATHPLAPAAPAQPAPAAPVVQEPAPAAPEEAPLKPNN